MSLAVLGQHIELPPGVIEEYEAAIARRNCMAPLISARRSFR
ncbi:MAG: hypothetical protein QM655_16860 [Nocardioidaceae bacterium]